MKPITITVSPEVAEEQILGEIRKILKEYPHSKATVLSQGGGFHLMVRVSPMTYVRRFYTACCNLLPVFCKTEVMLEKTSTNGDL